MTVVFSTLAQTDFDYWEKTGNHVVLNRIDRLLLDIQAHPYTGIGEPEPLKYKYAGIWSRRITDTHRLLYYCEQETLYIVSCRFHYSKK
jgi:toxin YoeB